MDVEPSLTSADPSDVDGFLATLASHRQRAQHFLSAQQTKLAQLTAELSARIEQYRDELRELQARNAELERKLASRPAESPPDQPVAVLNWELQKQRVLAALEAEGMPTEETRAAERIHIDELLRATDQELAAKNRELDELRQQLQEPGRGGPAAPADAARNEILDRDAVIREERENLRRLQKYWEEMLRQAEIDLSLERARLARERAEIDEKLRRLPPEAGSADDKKPARGRWLARLGLTADDSSQG